MIPGEEFKECMNYYMIDCTQKQLCIKQSNMGSYLKSLGYVLNFGCLLQMQKCMTVYNYSALRINAWGITN